MKKITAFLISIAMLASLVACTSAPSESTQENTGDTNESTAENTEQSDEVAPIEWLTTGDAGAAPMVENDRIVAEINEKFGIDLSVTIVPEGSVEKVNVAMATGDFPDIVTGSYGTAATQQWIDDGVLLDIGTYRETMPNIDAWLSNYEWTAVDGKYYGIPFITQFTTANALVMMRQDWLDAVGMEYPTTIDEFTAVITAFTNGDPDGNGENDTFGLSDVKPSAGSFNYIFAAFGKEYGDFALDGETLIPSFEDQSFKDGILYLQQLWNDKILDPEFLLNDQAKLEEKFYQGQIGAASVPLFRHVSRHETNLQSISPEAGIAYGLPPASADGNFGNAVQGKTGMYTGIVSTSEAPDKAAAFIDFMISEEGTELVRLGIEGLHYTMDGDTIVYNEEERAADAFSANGWAHPLAWGSFYWPLESNFLPVTEPSYDRALESVELASEAQLENLVKFKTEADIQYGTACDDIYVQYLVDLIQGKMDVDQGIADLGAEWRAAGGDAILTAAQEAYDATK